VIRLAALDSGGGRNLQALIDAIESGRLDARLEVVIASRAKIEAVERARRHGIPVEVVSRKAAPSLDVFQANLLAALSRHQIDLIMLCGFLSFLSPDICSRYRGRIMNIHPSLLPAFGGQGHYGGNVHEEVLNHGCKVTGCTVMFVDEGQDSGPIILQEAVPVLDGDTPASLGARVMQAEYRLYPQAVALFAAGRLSLAGRRVHILPQPR
jgi:formyltetrahydrofolate-dependent phosphoribosylglycinamide formyltransferase